MKPGTSFIAGQPSKLGSCKQLLIVICPLAVLSPIVLSSCLCSGHEGRCLLMKGVMSEKALNTEPTNIGVDLFMLN
jgi:hypothetical protein